MLSLTVAEVQGIAMVTSSASHITQSTVVASDTTVQTRTVALDVVTDSVVAITLTLCKREPSVTHRYYIMCSCMQ